MFKTTPISVSEVENYIWGNEFMINATSRESIYPELLVVIQLNANNQIGKFQSTVNIFQGKVSVFKPYFIIWKWVVRIFYPFIFICGVVSVRV